LSPPTSRSTSATYASGAAPGSVATFRAPGMWLVAYSEYFRESRTTALPSARIRRSSSVLTSAVFWSGSSKVAWKMLPTWAFDTPNAAGMTATANASPAIPASPSFTGSTRSLPPIDIALVTGECPLMT
jgi:hypothetical protein